MTFNDIFVSSFWLYYSTVQECPPGMPPHRGGGAPHNHSKPTAHRRRKKNIWASSASFTELNCQVSLINIKNCRCNDRVYTCRYTRCVDEMCVVVIVVIFPRTNTHNILRIEGGGLISPELTQCFICSTRPLVSILVS